jgi:hypothetical protein
VTNYTKHGKGKVHWIRKEYCYPLTFARTECSRQTAEPTNHQNRRVPHNTSHWIKMLRGEHLLAHDEIMCFSASTTPLECVHYQCTTHMVEKAEHKRFTGPDQITWSCYGGTPSRWSIDLVPACVVVGSWSCTDRVRNGSFCLWWKAWISPCALCVDNCFSDTQCRVTVWNDEKTSPRSDASAAICVKKNWQMQYVIKMWNYTKKNWELYYDTNKMC